MSDTLTGPAIPPLTKKSHPLAGKDILFTRQRHDAKRAGLHWDYRLVLGDKAYSWATKKELPEPGKAIILFEQPVHDTSYALRKRIYIPPGFYGSGLTTLDWVHKAKVDPETEEGKLVVNLKDGRKFLLKQLEPNKYGDKSWLFKNLTKTGTESSPGFTRQILKEAAEASLQSRFQPDLTPDQMERLGVLRHPGSQYGEGTDKDNYFGVSASLKTWPQKWHNEEHPQGWYQWYKGYSEGKRTVDDERQIKRWISFKARHLAQLRKADPTLEDLSIQPKRRQALLNWGIAPGDKNKYLTKLAKDSAEKLRPQQQAALEKLDKNDSGKLRKHQEEALAKLDKNDGLILHHFLGSGKTITFLTAAKRALDSNPGKEALIVAPASLVTNVDKELEKHKIKLDRKRLNVMSYEKAHNMAEELGKKKLAIGIADEAHKLRNPDAKRTQSLSEVFSRADKRLLSTATANYNSPSDIAILVNIAAGYEALPTNKKDFENRYLRRVYKHQGFVDRMLGRPKEETTMLTREHELEDLFKDHVHHYDPKEDPAAKDKFPTVHEKYIGVDMSPEQLRYYKYMEGKIPFLLRMKIRHGMPLDKQEKTALNVFSQGVRQTSNSYRHLVQDSDSVEVTPKIKRAVDSLEEKMKSDKNFRGLVYSNYLEAGVEEYARELKKRGIKHGVFTGKLSKEEKDKLRDEFNAGKLPALLISSSGAEGLDLKGTKLTQILDQHFNKSKLKQVIGRGARFESHEHLPKEEKKLEVEHYLSTHPKSITGHAPDSIDVYLSKMSDDKDEVFDKIKTLMKENS